MALTKCPECSAEMSDTAPACPHCGSQAIARKKKEAEEWTHFGLILLLVGGVALAFWMNGGSCGNTSSQDKPPSPPISAEARAESDKLFDLWKATGFISKDAGTEVFVGRIVWLEWSYDRKRIFAEAAFLRVNREHVIIRDDHSGEVLAEVSQSDGIKITGTIR